MKNLKLFALALVLGTTSLFANPFGLPEDDELNKKIRNQIVEILETPDFTVANDIDTMITFTFNSEGEIVVLNVDSKSGDILNYVRKNINGKKIGIPGIQGNRYIMPLKMKQIN